ncbi:T9SS type A sorting domain-containing protein [bacterium]|nr:T9SS type A sorting domain-containing protein [bacterium]
MRYRTILLPILIVVLITPVAFPQENITQIADVVLIEDHVYGTYLHGDYLYMASSEAGIQVIQVANPANPVAINTVDTPGFASQIEVVDHYLYLADCTSLRTYDISDPEEPEFITESQLSGYHLDMFYQEASELLFLVTNREFGIQVFDVSDRENPSFETAITGTEESRSVYVVENLVYVVDQIIGLIIYDISDLENPVTVTEMEFEDPIKCATIRGQFAYIWGFNSFIVVDISNPEFPFVTDSVGLQFGVAEGEVIAPLTIAHLDFVFILRLGDLYVVNVADPYNVYVTGSHELVSAGREMEVQDHYIFVPTHLPFQVFDCADALDELGREQDFAVSLNGRRFNLLSTYLTPQNLNADAVFGGIENLTIVQSALGDFFIPDVIPGDWEIDVTQAYNVYPSEFRNHWQVRGEFLRTDQIYTIDGNRWNWIGYPFDERYAIDQVLDGIRDEVVIVMTDHGAVWIPEEDLNTIGSMTPTQGYYVFAEEDLEFQYEPFLGRGTLADTWDIPEVENAPYDTGLPYIVLVELSENLGKKNPALIEIYDENCMVGKAAVLADKPFTPVTTWEGDHDHDLPGFTEGHVMEIRVLGSDGAEIGTNSETALSPIFGEGPYTKFTLDAANESGILPSDFNVSNAYPNPFNPSVNVAFTIPTTGVVKIQVRNILGQLMYSEENIAEAGRHSFVFDSQSVSRQMSSGIYYLSIEFEGQIDIQKIVLLK